MESNTTLPTPNRASSTSWQRSSSTSHTKSVSSQIRLEPTSSEVISNLITSLSSMPALTARSSDHPVLSPLASLTSPIFSLPGNSGGQNNHHSHLNGCCDEDTLSEKHSCSRKAELDRSTEKKPESLLGDRASESISILSERSSRATPSHASTSIHSSPKDESRPISRDSDVLERISLGNFSVEPGNAPSEIGRKSLENWSKRRVTHSTSKEYPQDKEQVRKDSVNTSKRRRNPTQTSNELFSLASEETASRELGSVKSDNHTNSWGLSIPVRQSSLPYTGDSVRLSLSKSRSCITADNNSIANEEPKRAHMKKTGRDSVTLQTEKSHELPSEFPFITSKFPNENSPQTLPTTLNSDRESRPESSFTNRKTRSSRPPSSSKTNSQPRIVIAEQSLVDERPSSVGSIDEAVEAYLCAPRLSQKIRHPQTGRVISFSEVGDSEGFAVFCCVGMGLTRYVTAFYDELASMLKLRLITPDRPGVGDSQPYNDGTATPLSWPDDVYAICQSLKITKFSLLAHSAGAIYALATALRMPHHIRGRIHLLAPWIPPSQMNAIGGQVCLPPNNSLPTSQRILRVLPTPILRAANSSFISATSNSLTSSLPKQRKTKRRSTGISIITSIEKDNTRHNSLMFLESCDSPIYHTDDAHLRSEAAILAAAANSLAIKERQVTYQSRLTQAIWDLATQGANPAIDLLVCLERRHTIGFRYVDITRAVVIHHGSKDTRVPVENVLWMGKTMKRCDVRVLEGEGHSLMASASIMSCVLTEIAKEWEDWIKVTNSTGLHRNEGIRRTLRERASLGAFR